MGSRVKSLSSDIKQTRQEVYPLDSWTISTKKGIILQSRCTCIKTTVGELSPTSQSNDQQTKCDMCRYAIRLPNLHNMPDMLFHNNMLKVEHRSGAAIEFNALDALQRVEETKDPLRVAVGQGWQSAASNLPYARKVVRPFDWTFTTDYRGTMISAIRKSNKIHVGLGIHSALSRTTTKESDTTTDDQGACSSSEKPLPGVQVGPASFLVEETDERIDVNKLKKREEIMFYNDIPLYEDELADHGTASYSVKVRVMPKSFYILARFYLRIDGLLSRINDTRIYHEFSEGFLLREYTNREGKLGGLDLPMSTITNPNELMTHLPVVNSCYEKITLPKSL